MIARASSCSSAGIYIYSMPSQIKTWIQELNENEFTKPIQILRKYKIVLHILQAHAFILVSSYHASF
jgi:hypothetical protein